MNESHTAYLNLGSNIQPEINLVRAIGLLKKFGEIQRVSSVWESKAVGAAGPNYLNVCVSFVSSYSNVELKEKVIHSIETQLGRIRTQDKYSPRTIDIDIILFDDKPPNAKVWESAFVIVPLADIYPDYPNPVVGENILKTAERLREMTWMQLRPEVVNWNNP